MRPLVEISALEARWGAMRDFTGRVCAQGSTSSRFWRAGVLALGAEGRGGSCGSGWESTNGCREARAPWKPGHVHRAPQNTAWFLTSSCRVGPSPVSTQARQRRPPWIPRKMGTLVRSRPLLGSMQIFSGRKEREESQEIKDQDGKLSVS